MERRATTVLWFVVTFAGCAVLLVCFAVVVGRVLTALRGLM